MLRFDDRPASGLWHPASHRGSDGAGIVHVLARDTTVSAVGRAVATCGKRVWVRESFPGRVSCPECVEGQPAA